MKHGSLYTPTTTRGIERLNQTVLKKLKKLSNFGKVNWKDCLMKATAGYNKSYHRAIDCALLELIGKTCEFKIDREYDTQIQWTKPEYLEKAIQRIK